MGRTVKVKFDSREPELKELLERVMPDVEVFFGDTLFTALNITAQKCRARNNPESKDLSAKFDEMLITNGDYIFSDIDHRLINKKESVSDYAELTGENYYACISISSKKKSKEEIIKEILEKIKDKPLSEIRKDENYPLVEITKGDFKGQKIYQNQTDALENILSVEKCTGNNVIKMFKPKIRNKGRMSVIAGKVYPLVITNDSAASLRFKIEIKIDKDAEVTYNSVKYTNTTYATPEFTLNPAQSFNENIIIEGKPSGTAKITVENLSTNEKRIFDMKLKKK